MRFIAKSTDFHGPFWLPGTRLFSDFCKTVVHRYCLDGLVMPAKVCMACTIWSGHVLPGDAGQGITGECLSVPAKEHDHDDMVLPGDAGRGASWMV